MLAPFQGFDWYELEHAPDRYMDHLVDLPVKRAHFLVEPGFPRLLASNPSANHSLHPLPIPSLTHFLHQFRTNSMIHHPP
jgi:hypothetical protein